MTKKYVTRTTKEYMYDEKGFIVKEVVTEENYEVEVDTGEKVSDEEIKKSLEEFKKAQGVPYITETNPFVKPYTVTHDTVKEDTDGITHNVINTTINVQGKLSDDVMNQVKNALYKDESLKSLTLNTKIPPIKKPLKKPSI